MTDIKIIPDGPAVISGGVKIETADGEVVFKEKTALCRCGRSADKIYCDGSHAISTKPE